MQDTQPLQSVQVLEALPLPNTPATSVPNITPSESNQQFPAPELKSHVVPSPPDDAAAHKADERILEESKKRPCPDEGEGHEEAAEQEENLDETRGRWAPEEHMRFLEALHKHGNLWAQVAQCVGTRTPRQTRSHAQKYFRKLRLQELQKIKQDPARANYIFVITREYRNRIPAPEYVIELPVYEKPEPKPAPPNQVPSLPSASPSSPAPPAPPAPPIPSAPQAPPTPSAPPAPPAPQVPPTPSAQPAQPVEENKTPAPQAYPPMTPVVNPYYGLPFWALAQTSYPCPSPYPYAYPYSFPYSYPYSYPYPCPSPSSYPNVPRPSFPGSSP